MSSKCYCFYHFVQRALNSGKVQFREIALPLFLFGVKKTLKIIIKVLKSFSLHYFAIFRTPCFDTMMREIRVEANFFRILNFNIKIHSNALCDDFYTYTYLLFTLLTKWTLAFIQKKISKRFRPLRHHKYQNGMRCPLGGLVICRL